MTEPKEDHFEATRMTLGEHLDELRRRLIKGVIAVVVTFAVAWYFGNELQEIIFRPYHQAMTWLSEDWVEQAESLLAENAELADKDESVERWGRDRFFMTDDPEDKRLRGLETRMRSIGVAETFLFKIKICLYCALCFGAPVLLWQMWQFVAAGLYEKERRAILKYFPLSVIMFVAGILFGYFLMVPYAMYFLNRDADLTMLLPEITVGLFLDFMRGLCLAFGVIFQLPLVMSFLCGTGMVQPAFFAKYRGQFIVGGFVLAALITPPDPITQLMMAFPLVILYECGIWGGRLVARRRQTAVTAADLGRS